MYLQTLDHSKHKSVSAAILSPREISWVARRECLFMTLSRCTVGLYDFFFQSFQIFDYGETSWI